jgi:hypothetical protein
MLGKPAKLGYIDDASRFSDLAAEPIDTPYGPYADGFPKAA